MATYVDPVVALLLSEHVIQPEELDWKAKNETCLTVEMDFSNTFIFEI